MHDALIHSGSNEVTLQYLSGLIDMGKFSICVTSNNYDESACDADTIQKLNNLNMYSSTYS